jgi:D-cysteine desulfhydrase
VLAELPLTRRFPALAALPRVPLGSFPTPVQRIPGPAGRDILVKRDDHSGARVGGNKVRALEWTLAGVGPHDRIVTLGARGSTHALATALLARELGASVTVVRWNQEMNAAAAVVDRRLRDAARVIDARSVPAAYLVAMALRLRGMRWIPAGGLSTLALLGHVNAGLELAEQLAKGDAPRPDRVFVPFGTGGTAAGIALGLRIAAVELPLTAVRVVPAILARRGRLLRLAARAARLIEHLTGSTVPRLREADVTVEHRYFGGAYGRALSQPVSAAETSARALGIRLDDTYSRKTFVAAEQDDARRPLVWLSFDGRLLQD